MPPVRRSRRSWQQLLARDRGDARERGAHPVHAALARRVARRWPRRTRPRGSARASSTLRRRRPPRAAPRASALAGLRLRAVDQRVQPRAELRDAQHLGRAARARARAARSSPPSISTTVGVDPAHQLARRALRDDPPAVEDREPVAALGLVHVVRRDEDRGAAVDQPEQRSPRSRAGSADRRRWSARRGTAARARGSASRRRARAAGAGRPRACRRAGSRDRRRRNSSSSASMRARAPARAQRVDLAEEVEVLAHR